MGEGEIERSEFRDFIEKFELRYQFETDCPKISYRTKHLTGLSLGISSYVRNKKNFEVMEALKRVNVDLS